MEAEDEFRRPSAPSPYILGISRLSVPLNALSATVALLQHVGRLESAVFWYGPRSPEGHGLVKFVVAPAQHMTWGNYSITTDTLTAIVNDLPEGWKPLAQIHSHPGSLVEHSNYDDLMVSSKKALSLVFPYYGKYRGSFPAFVGIHEFQNNYWHLLNHQDAQRRVPLTAAAEVKIEDHRQRF